MKALLVCLEARSQAGGRLPCGLAEAGFTVRAISRPDARLAATRHVGRCDPVPPGISFKGLAEALRRTVEEWQPDFLIPCDDFVVWFLHDLHRACSADPRFRSTIALIELSLGAPVHYGTVERRSLLAGIAGRAQVRMPPQLVAPAEEDAVVFARRNGWRVFVKADFTGGGAGLSCCASEPELRAALRRPEPRSWSQGRTPVRSVQHRVAGVPACVSLAALRGEMLAAFAFRRIRSFPPPHGPASVIEVIDAPRLTDAAGRLVAALGYSGFAAVDFILSDADFRLLEFNARPSATSHLGPLAGADLCRALHDKLAWSARAAPAPAAPQRRIALFPMEWLRDPESAFLRTAYHDVPWADPHLLRALVDNGLAFAERLRRRSSRFPAQPGASSALGAGAAPPSHPPRND